MDLPAITAALPALGWAVHSSVLGRRLARARRDPLTGLHTRAGWTTRAERILATCPTALVVLVDLDKFKTINDTWGHATGDAVLAATAARLSAWCGRAGIPARLGGDEFAVVTTRALDVSALTTMLQQPVPVAGTLVPVGASVGFCHRARLPLPSLTDALSAADTAMYRAKGHGRRNHHPAERNR
ncbi:GGDEF domain-containing protein [Streptomyces sp. LP05-1]|uniref:GGDEF domain-containing protein n=1 Tax=Streptomyces pyxinae TaxID=2970734 RepID=A0ABT2CN66_9ACTN|nr:GGDEF domain-containing protein [Streptomyces sp. LP05-1]MCS0638745.1 GGDEF domain-containing protein [Streptomyces sp. LP05-1]